MIYQIYLFTPNHKLENIIFISHWIFRRFLCNVLDELIISASLNIYSYFWWWI